MGSVPSRAAGPPVVSPAAGSTLAIGPADLPSFESPLVRRFPGLSRLPRVRLLPGPTPVVRADLAGLPAGLLWVKRDDRSCALYGGNKPRKLEWLLGAAAARGSRRLVTTGGIGTHHGLATAILGRAQGMATTLVAVPQPVTEHVLEQLRALLAFGVEIAFARGVPGAALAVLRALGRSGLRGERPTLIPTGGSSALGDVGFVSAALELAEQVEAGAVPAPSEIHVPVGTGGTLAGLVLGAKLAGLRARVLGVLVTDILPPSPRRLATQAAAALRLLRRADASVPAVRIGAGDFELTRAQLGPGYGAATQAGRAAVETARSAGLALDLTYTAKCLAETLARLRDGRTRPPVLLWNTYNAVDFWAHAPARPSLEALPSGLRTWLERAPAGA